MRTHRTLLAVAAVALIVLPCAAQQAAAGSSAGAPGGLSLPVTAISAPASASADAGALAWNQVAVRRIALHRTPRMHETEPPSEPEISSADVRLARAGRKLLLQLSWADPTEDVGVIAQPPDNVPEKRNEKILTESTSRFFDSAAIMLPANGAGGTVTPSLQMGDAQHPVTIYYWNAARGAMLMEARGRETTKRTGRGFPATSAYVAGRWTVTFELPDFPRDTPLAFAVWNGSQEDRDGRKYFSVWHFLE